MKPTISSIIALTLAALVIVVVDEVSSMPHPPEGLPQCDPEYVQQVDSPKIRKICNFLQNYADAMKQFRASGDGYMDGPLALNMLENGVKRQDLDHVFLRFGRRRRR